LTAVAGQDYDAVSGTLTFPPWAPSNNVQPQTQTIHIPIHGNTIADGNRSFRLVLDNPTQSVLPLARIGNAAGGGASAEVTILDNETIANVRFDSPGNILEGDQGTTNGVFDLQVSGTGIAGTFTVTYATQDITARAGTDYIETNGTLSIQLGATTGFYN